MRWRLLVSNGLLFGALAWTAAWATGGEMEVGQVLPSRTVPGVASADFDALEARAARAPTTAAVAALATAYLDRDQPGLASAVVEHAPLAVQEKPEVAQLYARALFSRGEPRQALAVAERASTACAEPLGRCPGWLVAKTARQVAFFGQVVAAGIADPHADPDATQAAYERSSHEVGLVAMR